MSNQRIRETFNDGKLSIVTQTTKRNELRKKIGTSYESVAGPLGFRKLSIRNSDYTAMDASGSKLSKKVKTPFHPIAKKFNKDKYFVLIDSDYFNVIYVDSDNYYLFWYLEKAGDSVGLDEESE